MIQTISLNKKTYDFKFEAISNIKESKNLTFELVFKYNQDNVLSLYIYHSNSEIKYSYRIPEPVLSIGHENYITDHLHFIYSLKRSMNYSLMFIVDCGQKVPEFRIYESNREKDFFDEKVFLINHKTQDEINEFIESLNFDNIIVTDKEYKFDFIL